MDWKDAGRRIIKEPLAHFLIAGTAVFWVMSGRPPDLGERRVVVDEVVVNGLMQRFYDSFRRLPTTDEMDGLIRDYVADQVYYREAIRLGLDQGDEVVMRRMRRKMEGMAVSEAETAEPSDAQLQALIDKDPARYSEDPRTSFEQVYLGADTPENRLLANAYLVQLRGGKPVSGVPAPLPASLTLAPAASISGQFGDEFTLSLAKLPPGQWQGPVASGLGLHLVRITVREAPSPPRLDRVRQRVTNDWRAAAILKAQGQAYDAMLKGYDVVIVPVK